MKIFNWVQRKLHQNVITDGVVKTVKKNEPSEIDKNTKAILDQVGLVDVLENWVDGVLTIGTFGFDTLKYSDDKEKYDTSLENEEEQEQEEVGDDDDDDDDESMDLDEDEFTKNSLIVYKDEELDPLISTTCAEVVGSEDNGDDLGFGIMDSELIRAVHCVDLIPEDGGGKKRRTTLAELFMEDGDTHFKKCLNPLEIDSSYGKYKLHGPKLSRLPFAKKIVSRVKDQDSRPIKKLHQMMKRMLKRKIHPDVDVVKTCKSDGLNKPIKKSEAVESIRLLNIPGPLV